MHLATFAMDAYADDPCTEFLPKVLGEDQLTEKNRILIARMHKAISVLQFKLEAQLFHRNPLWNMEDRDMLGAIDYIGARAWLPGRNIRCCHAISRP